MLTYPEIWQSVHDTVLGSLCRFLGRAVTDRSHFDAETCVKGRLKGPEREAASVTTGSSSGRPEQRLSNTVRLYQGDFT
jgi:hypothetical protein